MIQIEFPDCPPLLLNSRLHWRTLHRERARWKDLVYVMTRATARKIGAPIDRAKVRYTRFCGYIEPDHDNLVSGFKWIQDGLVEAGILANDTASNITPTYHWVKCQPKFKRTLVEILPEPGTPA